MKREKMGAALLQGPGIEDLRVGREVPQRCG